MAIIAILVGTSRADQTAVTFNYPFWSGGTGVGVYGWQFTARSDIRISALGIYDDPGVYDGGFIGNGLLEQHTIGIWEVSNHSSPLGSSLIPAGTVAPLVNGFRYVNISPLELLAGRDYVIAATYQAQDWTTGDYTRNPAPGMTISPEINFGGYRSSGSSVLVFPQTYNPGIWYGFGPNFTYTVVPEPSTLAICMLGAALFGSTKSLRLRSGSVKPSPKMSV